jgi:hypothetical protein
MSSLISICPYWKCDNFAVHLQYRHAYFCKTHVFIMFYLGKSWLGRGSGGSYELIYKRSSSNLLDYCWLWSDADQIFSTRLRRWKIFFKVETWQFMIKFFPSLDYSSLEHFILRKFESEKETSSNMPKTIYSGCSITKKSAKQENSNLFMNSIWKNGTMRVENQAKTRVWENSSLRRLEFVPRNLD